MLERVEVLFILHIGQYTLTYVPEHLVKWLRIVDLVLFQLLFAVFAHLVRLLIVNTILDLGPRTLL